MIRYFHVLIVLIDGANQSFAEWSSAQGLFLNAIVQMPGEYRQQSETNDGDRLSFSGGVEYRPTENLKLGFNVIYTKRELDGSRLEQLEMRLDQSTVGITPLEQCSPRATGLKATGGEPGRYCQVLILIMLYYF